MKRIVIVLIGIFICAISSFGQNTIIDNGIFYQILPNQKDVAVIMSQSDSIKYSGKVVIPATVSADEKVYNVTHIFNYAFAGSDITSITLPEGLLEIGYESFRQCYGLTSVVIPASVLHINNNAFIFCFNLTSLTFKSSTRPIIGDMAFGRTQIKVNGIDTGISSNMFVPDHDDKRFKIDRSRRAVVY